MTGQYGREMCPLRINLLYLFVKVCRVLRAARKKGQQLKLCVNLNFTKAREVFQQEFLRELLFFQDFLSSF